MVRSKDPRVIMVEAVRLRDDLQAPEFAALAREGWTVTHVATVQPPGGGQQLAVWLWPPPPRPEPTWSEVVWFGAPVLVAALVVGAAVGAFVVWAS